MRPPAIAVVILLHVVQQVRCFTCASHPFNGRPTWRPPTTATTWYFPTKPYPSRQLAQTPGRSQTKLLSSATDVIPITVLSGFLGSGKTTCLQHMLNNNEGLKIGVIVNDVASVNIDSKLVRGKFATPEADGIGNEAQGQGKENSDAVALPAGIVELQNGCACCSISGELLSGVSELLTISDLRQDDERFDHIVIEMSGVAEPRSVRNIFQEAMMYDMPLMDRVRLDTLVTVVDCSTYLDKLQSKQLANVLESPELFFRDEEDRKKAEEKNEMIEGIPQSLADMLTGATGESGYEGGVCDLLVDQTEVADVVLLNKIDILDGELGSTKELVAALNPRAKIFSTSFGKIEQLDEILAVTKGDGVAMDGVVDDHKDYIAAADAPGPLDAHDQSHSHDDHSADGPTDDAACCGDPECTDTSHDHSHRHSSDTATASADPDCTDTSHGHSNSHSPDTATGCADPDCTDTSHSHSHSNSSDTEVECKDPDCTDTSHSHSHSHSSETVIHAGIGSYVYRARRPFHPSRLLSILQKLPVVRGVPSGQSGGNIEDLDENVNKVFKQVLRSKGFAWTADSNVKALYWSHAGSSFEMQCLGRWWATLPKQQWPEEATDSILADFDALDHDDTAASPTTSTVGDRRQEVVFIGPGVGSPDSQAILKSALDSCLLNDDEWDIFRSKRNDEASLTYFENPLKTRMLTY